VSLTYCSELRDTPSNLYEILDNIEKSCVDWNSCHGISGFLVYLYGNFIQRIEGHHEKVERLYSKISLDTRHTEVSLISFEKIQNRAFSNWQKLFNISHQDADKIPHLVNLISQNEERLLTSSELLILLNLISDIAEKSNAAQTPRSFE
jgi:hypothetical protein